ncbi:MAG: SDR family oxidoreductase [Pseudomonadota bacterium]
MELNNARILLTGATGGLGRALAEQLSKSGAALLLAGRDNGRLEQLRASLTGPAGILQADLNTAEGIATARQAAREFNVNVLINNAGVGCFGLLEQQAWEEVEQVLHTNLATPIRLTQALLPWLMAQPQAAIVNMGSTFGSLPFAGFSAYSAAKAGLRGFSQALRRELADTRVEVIHLAPRAIDTPLNSPQVNALNQALGNHSDRAEDVAAQIVATLKRGDRERHFGFPERLFAWLNGVVPGLIDQGLAGKIALIKKHASQG